MKKILYFLAIFIAGTVVFAQTVQENTDLTQNAVTTPTEPEYTTVNQRNEIFYYDKYGKMIARDKKVDNQTFFYNKVGQLVGKSVERNGKTYYYNQISKFIGVCDDNGCVDKDFVSTGKIPPLPAIKHFVPVYDNNIMNPPPKTTDEEE